MKSRFREIPYPFASQKGVALVIVLMVLVLLTILVVGFLSRATMERSSASAYFDGGQNTLLADQAVNIVQAQIDHASTQPSTAWASQPGMVRTFRENGDLLQAYKLYSDQAMVTDSVNIQAAVADLQGWYSSPAHFVDLNAPARSEVGWEYPIVSPSALDKNGEIPLVKGFEVINAPTEDAELQPIPMPVRWLYVLEDGQVVAPDNVSGRTAQISAASAENPIIGRIAFWTDDETSKLNINTASHGGFWDIPRAFTLGERDRMARFQPALREYQRYPGHPATTSLWPVLGYKTAQESDFGTFIYPIVPRIQLGGSEGGTKFAGAQPVVLDNDRLFSSVDEIFFQADFDESADERPAQPLINRDDLERTRFFLTARSNSPEVNLFNLPRMAIWPINTENKNPSTLDELIAFCATINGKAYYLQRSDAESGYNDWKLDEDGGRGRNEKLFDYINALLSRPFPSFGNTSFVAKYTEPETRQIVTSIFDYIRSSNLYSTVLGATGYTGSGNKPLDTQGSRAGQVTPLQTETTKGFGRIPAISQAVFHLYVSGMQSDAGTYPSPQYPINTGRLPYYSGSFSGEGAEMSYQSLRAFLDATGADKTVQLLTSGVLYFDTFDPMLGYARPRYNFDIEVEFSGNWQVNGQPLNFPNATIQINRDQALLYDAKSNNWAGAYYGRYYGGHLGPLWMMQNYTYIRGNTPNTAGGRTLEYPLGTLRIPIHLPLKLEDENEGKTGSDGNPLPPKPTLPPNSQISTQSGTDENGNVTTSNVISFSGGTVTARIKVGSEVVQTYTFTFPGFQKPGPVYAPRGYLTRHSQLPEEGNTLADFVLKQFATNADFKNRWVGQPFNNKRSLGSAGHIGGHSADCCDVYLIQPMDVITALEPAYGDKRIIAALREVRSSGADPNFVPHKDYTDSNLRVAADFRNDYMGGDRKRRAEDNATRPGRILNIPYASNAMPDVPSRYPEGVKETTDGSFWPDFDNGTLHTPDDAYVNRADEGSANTAISDGLIGTDTGSRSFSWYGDAAGSTDNAIFFSPNKQMPSAGMFGSLPTGAVRNKPWQTLLFRPDPGNHPGAQSPPDYLLLDLFWMPVVEPYAISEPFSSNGKVNMNYQIMPFGYIHRSSALLGVLQNQELVSINNSDAYSGASNAITRYGSSDNYKKFSYNDLATSLSTVNIRRKLNLSRVTGTLKPFEDLFAQNRIFRSETQICSIPLIPEDASWSANFESAYWDTRRLTGDNSREVPYTQLLPRLTTRSNTYTVHFRVQTLKKSPTSDPSVWDEDNDKITSEFRGSRTIERYINPNDERIPDYAGDPSASPSLDAFYRWRMLYNRTFAP